MHTSSPQCVDFFAAHHAQDASGAAAPHGAVTEPSCAGGVALSTDTMPIFHRLSIAGHPLPDHPLPIDPIGVPAYEVGAPMATQKLRTRAPVPKRDQGQLAFPSTNKFCRSTDLSNEATVESFFALRLLHDLGYRDSEICPKHSLDSLKIARGRKRENHRPDFLIMCNESPMWLVEAKPTTDNIEDWVHQGAGYSFEINRQHKDRPVRYFLLTTGLLTRVYQWDKSEALLSMRFEDFTDDNPKYQALRDLLGAEHVRAGWPKEASTEEDGHCLTRPTIDEVKRAFLRCHRIIWKAEKMSPQAAFVGFAKLLFVKLWQDRRLRDNPATLTAITSGQKLPADTIKFCVEWVEKQERSTPNPVDSILFRDLLHEIEIDIESRRRKRIFDRAESLGISPGTVKRVVAELQNYYLFGIDEDLNGRMFEAFLSATMRGQDLGQYFTPRSIVKLMLRLANLEASKKQIDRVLDACCGTGGFLIEALTEMRSQLYKNTALTSSERKRLLDEVANEAMVGIDAGRDPPLARIARINMYLHGDGGSRVYIADGLRHPPQASHADPPEVKNEVAELRRLLDDGLRFDVVLTNPPFSMDYSESVPEEREVLRGYTLAEADGRRRSALRSSVMFIERYYNLLKPGGRLLTVIDDSILGGEKNAGIRNFIRERFVIRAIISLHGDAFRRKGARVKTSILYLARRTEDAEEQPDVFVYESQAIGLDDVSPKTRPSEAAKARKRAIEEIDEIATAFESYINGKKGAWLVPATSISERLDVKFLKPWSVASLKSAWETAGAKSVALEDLVDPIEDPVRLDPEEEYTFLKVTYEGKAEYGERRIGSEVSYQRVCRAKQGDIVVSHIRAVDRAICVIPATVEEVVVSPEYTILRVKDGKKTDAMYLWSVLRSTAVVAELLSSSSGQARFRTDWGRLKRQMLPVLPYAQQRRIGDMYRAMQEYEEKISQIRHKAMTALDPLGLDCDAARERLERAKPPQ